MSLEQPDAFMARLAVLTGMTIGDITKSGGGKRKAIMTFTQLDRNQAASWLSPSIWQADLPRSVSQKRSSFLT